MFYGGGPPGGGGSMGHHGAFDEDEVLGKAYDNRVIARLPKYLAPVKSWLALGVGGIVVRSLAALSL